MRYIYQYPRRNRSARELFYQEMCLDVLGLVALLAALSPFLLLVAPCGG